MRDISEILVSIRGFLGRAIERCESNSTTTERGCHGNEI